MHKIAANRKKTRVEEVMTHRHRPDSTISRAQARKRTRGWSRWMSTTMTSYCGEEASTILSSITVNRYRHIWCNSDTSRRARFSQSETLITRTSTARRASMRTTTPVADKQLPSPSPLSRSLNRLRPAQRKSTRSASISKTWRLSI